MWSAGTAKLTILQFLFFLLTIIKSSLLAEIRWSVCISKSYKSLCVLFSRTGSGFCIYHLFVWSKLNFLHISQWITLPTQLCLVLYSFCANLLHSLINSIGYIYYFVVSSMLSLIWLVLTALFWAAIRRGSVSLLKFPFLSHVQVLLCEMLFKTPTELFPFQFLFPSYCHCVVRCVINTVCDGCNESSIVFLYIIFVSLYRCVNAAFNAGESSYPSFLDTYSL